MTTELVTAHAGTNHVGSEDVGAMQAATLGAGRYAVELGDNLAVSMDDANTVRIGTGGFFLDGRFVRVSEAETVKVANGSQGAYRKDLVTYTYERDPSSGNVETGTWGVLQGTAASKESDARAPEFEAGNVLDGGLKATVAVAEVDLAGLTPTARLLLPSVASLKSLGESVSQLTGKTDWTYLYGNASGDQVRYRRNGGIVELYWNYVQMTAQRWFAGTIPAPLRPAVGATGACMRAMSSGHPTNNVATYEVWADGRVFFTTTNEEDSGRVVGYCCWPVG